eukprot:4940781-Alexandrium_andersonii.AAC.1
MCIRDRARAWSKQAPTHSDLVHTSACIQGLSTRPQDAVAQLRALAKGRLDCLQVLVKPSLGA